MRPLVETSPERRPGELLLPAAVAPLLFGFLAWGFLGLQVDFATEPAFYVLPLAGYALLVAGRVLAWRCVPAAPWNHVLAGVLGGAGVGLVPYVLLDHFFLGGPGWPWTPVWAGVVAGAPLVLARHKPALQAAMRHRAPGRALSRPEAGVLAVLAVAYALLGFGAYRVFAGVSLLVPDPHAGRILMMGAAAYALAGVRLVFAFAAHGNDATRDGFVAWVRANVLQHALVAFVLVAYVAFRPELDARVPYFPFYEFAFALALFGFLLRSLRARVKRSMTELPAASRRRAHEPRVERRSDPDYEALRVPLRNFIEDGGTASAYERALRAHAGLADAEAEHAVAPLRNWRPAPPPLPLTLPWAAASAVVMMLGILGFLLALVPDHERTLRLIMILGAVGIGVYQVGGEAHRAREPWIALGCGLAGAAILTLVLGAVALPPDIPGVVAYAPGLLLAGVSLVRTLKLRRSLRTGGPTGPTIPPKQALTEGMRQARRRVLTIAAAILIAAVPVAGGIRHLASRGVVPDGFAHVYGELVGAAWFLALGFGGAASVRLAGYARRRPALAAEAAARRTQRLNIHREVMTRLGGKV